MPATVCIRLHWPTLTPGSCSWCSTGGLVSYTQLGRAYNTYEPSMGQTMNAAFLAALYGNLITPNISKIPGVVRACLLRCHSSDLHANHNSACLASTKCKSFRGKRGNTRWRGKAK